MATDASDHEQQRRELEQIRRQFAEVGKRMGSAFEPASPDQHRERPLALVPPTTPPDEQPAPPDEQPARPRWLWVAAVALIFALGTGFGYTLPRSGGSDPAPPVSTQAPRAHTVTSVPEACLETARKGDQMVHLFIVNDRSRRLAHRPSATPGQQGTTAVNKRPARQPLPAGRRTSGDRREALLS